ncbi:hypothetical protein DL96DRAFT_1711381 [Flagelloscypha sp. PMI_526]|nr:hypothetical protein DL96DRAFT_1711381 [Flagelloscypha sp. PMI_526]
MMTHMCTPITHVVVGNWELGAHFLHLFPRITHLAVICYGLPQLDWVQMWCSATAESLQTFVLIDGWSSWLPSSDNDDVVFLNTITTHPSFTAKLVLFRVTQFLETWHEISLMWKAVEEAIDSSNRNTLESGGQHFIEVND